MGRLSSLLRQVLGPRPANRAGRPVVGSVPAPLADYRGRLVAEYDPHPDGRPDPGEVVWTWVPFEDDPRQGKDRPVLLVGRDPDGSALLGLALTSKDHDRDAAQEARAGRHWFDIGAGAWDPQRRPSEVRLDRILRIEPARIRREGATVARRDYEAVIAAVHRAGR
jgi:hypothetical protein